MRIAKKIGEPLAEFLEIYYPRNMKTIAITIEEKSLQELDEFGKAEGLNRSEVVREAVSEYLADWRRVQDEEKELRIFRRLRKKLEAAADAMIREQAEP